MGIVSIGQPFSRTEDASLLTGDGRYTADNNLPGQAHGYVLRSPHAHAHIRSINTSSAQAAPGVVLVRTGADYTAAGFGYPPPMAPPLPNIDADKIYKPERPALVADVVRLVGDPVAFVVAESLAEAKDAAELIEVDYEMLPAVTTPAAATADGAQEIWPDCPANTSFFHEFGSQAETDTAFAGADHVVRQEMVVNRVSANPIENRASLADHDPASGRTTLYIPTQAAFGTRATLANVIFKEPIENFRVITGNIGGSFGMKGFYPENLLTVWAARQLGRPVKWESERQDSLVSDNHGRDKIADAELALDKDGNFLGLRVHIIGNLGAYLSPLGLIHTNLSLSGLIGVYKTPAAYVTVKGVFTNGHPTAPYRGSGRPDACYIIERLLDVAATETGIDRAELRARNLIASSDMPYSIPLGATYDCGDFLTVQNDALNRVDYAGFEKRRATSAKTGKLRGVGFANNIENAAAPGQEFAEMTFDAEGNVTIAAGTTDHGQGHPTMYTIIACDLLGISPDKVTVIEGDTDAIENGSGTGGSRVSTMGSNSVRLAAEGVIDKGKIIAAHLLETAVVDIEFDDGAFSVAGTDKSVSLDDVAKAAHDPAKLPTGLEVGLSELGNHQSKAPNYPSGCHACEVEIDRETGQVELVRYVGVSDCGRIINPKTFEGQVYGGVGQGAGQVLMESVLYDPETGQIQTGSFLDYAMPRSSDFCNMELADHPTFTETNPMGVKGAGEVGTASAMPAVINAVVDALSPLGIKHIDMPVTPAKVWAAIRDAEGA